MTFFILLILPYVAGLALLSVAFMSLRFLPYIAAIGIIIFAVTWLLG